MDKEYVVYEGPEFTIEWYYNERGKSQAKTYFDVLSRDRKLEAFELFMTMAKVGKILNITKFRHEGDGIFMLLSPSPTAFFVFSLWARKLSLRMPGRRKRTSCHLRKRRRH